MSRLYHSLEWYTRVYTTIDYGLERVFEALLTLDGKLSRKNFQHPMGGQPPGCPLWIRQSRCLAGYVENGL